MLFSSLSFVCCFFPAFFICYYIAMFSERLYAKKRGLIKVPTLARNIILLVFSLFFYCWGELSYGKPFHILLLLGSVLVNYAMALVIESLIVKHHTAARNVLIADIALNLGMLAYYKYTMFGLNTVNSLFGTDISVPQIILPIGISFFTFQIMSYVIDVYRRDLKAQKNPYIVAVYLCAFPQLIAGPIVRYSDVESQLTDRTETFDKVATGLRRFIIGLSKKVIIANTAAAVADGILKYGAYEYGALGGWIAAIAYAVQIYFDFSGYSDMAIGMGSMMGFDYLENFRHPYSATSVTDFWRRWHISLSGFFRDYVYIPLGGNRVSSLRWMLNMMIVWSLTGFWHGAAFTFLIWGVYYGIILIIEKKLLSGFLSRHRIFARIYTITAFMFGWVIFRAESFAALGKSLKGLFGGYGFLGNGSTSVFTILRRADLDLFFIVIAAIGIFLAFSPSKLRISLFRRQALTRCGIPYDGHTDCSSSVATITDILCILLLILCIVFLETNSYNPFIYFRF